MVLVLAVSMATGLPAPLRGPATPCPPNIPDYQRVFVPSADSCSDFYLCSHGSPYKLTCPSGLYFNPAIKRCDYPENVNCTDVTTPAPTVVPTQTTPSPVQSTTVPSNSSDFNNTLLALFQSQVLDDNEDMEEEILEAMKDFCPAHAGRYPVFFPNPSNCSSYFMCDHGEPQLRLCPDYLFFNNRTWTCDFPWKVDCHQPAPSPVNSTAADHQALNVQAMVEDVKRPAVKCPEVDGDVPVYLPDPDDCGSFFECSNGKPEGQFCPGDLLFNVWTSTCDFPSNVHCM